MLNPHTDTDEEQTTTTTETGNQASRTLQRNMNGGKSDPSSDINEDCIFCLIASGQDKYTEIIHKNNELVCFRDICPAAPHHYLIIPRQHILSCFSLHCKHVGLIERMADMGKAVLRDQGITDLKDIRLGFHRPPYTSVDHLHLHVLAPASQISQHMVHKFLPGTDRFVKTIYGSV
ncbi:adenosine 5'-monophosphoramidase HINT3-like isoform X2 [Centroberyx affinis]|uniref:adenosine 5'-monophosphoramidase HINT3-like isoform X2 n=1 Tax=Centroberyx affinis TaxID=166261 RepID=UPI003A5C6DEC